MLAGKDEYLQEASETIYRMSADELVRKRCRDREEYYQDLRSYERAIEKYERDKQEHEQDLRNYERAIEKYEHDRKEQESLIQDMSEQIRLLRTEIEQLKSKNSQ